MFPRRRDSGTLPGKLATTLGILGCVLIAGTAIWLPIGDEGFQWSMRSAALISILLTCSALGVATLLTYRVYGADASLFSAWIPVLTILVLIALTFASVGILLIPGFVLITASTMIIWLS